MKPHLGIDDAETLDESPESCDEADALLQHAARLLGIDGLEEDAGTCRALLDLLRAEESGFGNPLPALQKGWAGIEQAGVTIHGE